MIIKEKKLPFLTTAGSASYCKMGELTFDDYNQSDGLLLKQVLPLITGLEQRKHLPFNILLIDIQKRF